MQGHLPDIAAADIPPRRLFVFNGGFLTQGRVRRILELSGYDIRIGKPGADDLVGVWGQSPTSPRGEWVAGQTAAGIVRVEDAFLRSVLTGRDKQPPLGLLIDRGGVHFDPAQPSDLERLLVDHPLDDTPLLNRARDGIERLQRSDLSKYSGYDAALPPPDPGYVLVIDQTVGDASVKASRADRNRFREMLFCAREDHPTAQILIKSHPETMAGHRAGHYRVDDLGDGMAFHDQPTSPWALLEGARAVYTVSSQLGFEAILAGHKPVVFGQPFYMGWGLTEDRDPLDRRQRRLTRAQLFAAAMILYPKWYDPYRDRLCSFECALDTFEALTREWREDHTGWTASGMRLWKRRPLQHFFGRYKRLRFSERPARSGTRQMVWSSKLTPAQAETGAVRVEDGFLRSCGLGAELTPPLSLVCDPKGIYYDPTAPSHLEALISASPNLPDWAVKRAKSLVKTLTREAISKYNIGGNGVPDRLPVGRRILVPGQVEDDASIRLGAVDIATNLDLLRAVRSSNPAAVILYKPHPDVEAGLRPGAVEEPIEFADAVLTATSVDGALSLVDEVWTMTSTLGFEALLRGKRVVCFGQPFYAGWGLTDDRNFAPERRTARPTLAQLAHAVLIDYPRYFDPVTGLASPPEVAVERLASGTPMQAGQITRSIAKMQGLMASHAWLWR